MGTATQRPVSYINKWKTQAPLQVNPGGTNLTVLSVNLPGHLKNSTDYKNQVMVSGIIFAFQPGGKHRIEEEVALITSLKLTCMINQAFKTLYKLFIPAKKAKESGGTQPSATPPSSNNTLKEPSARLLYHRDIKITPPAEKAN